VAIPHTVRRSVGFPKLNDETTVEGRDDASLAIRRDLTRREHASRGGTDAWQRFP
jgi:hypothetical protein